jgi:hypothetical protein
MNSFQSESKKSGDEFELIVENDIISRDLQITGKNIHIKGIGVELDFIAESIYKDKIEFIEAKGGRSGGKKRPGAQRTDSVKKAICNGALLKHNDPLSYYVVYFSSPPKENSYSSEMIETALKYKITDEVRYC